MFYQTLLAVGPVFGRRFPIGISSGFDVKSSQSSVTKLGFSGGDNVRSSGIRSILSKRYKKRSVSANPQLADEEEDNVEHTLRYLRLGLLLPIDSQGQRENAHTEIAGT